MILRPTPLAGTYVIEPERVTDERGFFARMFSAQEFRHAGLDADVNQSSVSVNTRAGTLRGMHYQAAPHEESKLVRCTRGKIYDVAVDLRKDSHTFKSWFSVELSAENRLGLFIPKGCAHGFQTLTPDSEVFYQISQPYEPAASRGVRWDDPAFNVRWPAAERIISQRDRSYPDFVG